MATTKIATLTFRINPGLKKALCTSAPQKYRSIANMVDGDDPGLLHAKRHLKNKDGNWPPGKLGNDHIQ